MSYHPKSEIGMILRSLSGTQCPACGGVKKSNQSLCFRDFRSLEQDMQRKLWRRVGAGYEEAFEAALEFLKLEKGVSFDWRGALT
jgi:hypothetical protein